jgi:hypothetical protein
VHRKPWARVEKTASGVVGTDGGDRLARARSVSGVHARLVWALERALAVGVGCFD